MQAFLDDWQDDTCVQDELALSDDSEIPPLINQLDGARHTLLSLVVAEGNLLQVAGGPEHFVITSTEEATIHNLTNPEATDSERISVVAGGHEGQFEPKYVVSRSEATKCALAYFHAHKIPTEDPRFTWESFDAPAG
ncbi:hypothetical protein [Corynebacterium sp.]|uniref:hypothetical protein n=1 Tax=Corynebacterium sp. TaxID=1720 RepID=UPI0026DA8B76|nr:hypothetical protein [Corynebacterium sp.]MDO5077415.1 hypothetical protein [Corynebacterium sp.]